MTNVINIDMCKYEIPAAAGSGRPTLENILETGNARFVIQDIEGREGVTTEAKIRAFLGCISQARCEKGIRQGACESLLKASLYDYVKSHAIEAQAAIQHSHHKWDPNLKDVINKVHSLTAGILENHNAARDSVIKINMSEYEIPAADGRGRPTVENILETGNVRFVIQDIEGREGVTTEAKIRAFLGCISQAMSGKGIRQGACESLLKCALYDYVKSHPMEAQAAIQHPHHKWDPNLKDVINKVHYLTAGILGYHNATCNYVRKLAHHLHQRPFISGYCVLGAGMIMVGKLHVNLAEDPSREPDEKKRSPSYQGWGYMGMGAGMIVLPLSYIFNLASGDNP